MPDLESGNVVAGQARAGGVYIAPVGTALPTDTETPLDAAFVPLGYVSEDGVTIGQEVETEPINAWQSGTPIKTLLTSRVASIEFTMIEIKPETLALWFGQAVPTATAGVFSLDVLTDAPLPEMACVVDLLDGANAMRFVAGRAQMTEAGEIEITRSGAVGLPVTLGTLDDGGVLMHVLVKQAVVAP